MHQMQCRKGHELTPENTFMRENGYRGCRACKREAQRESQRRRRGQAAPPVDPAKSEACRRGGMKTAANREFMAAIGRMGGQAHDRKHLVEIGRWSARKRQIAREERFSEHYPTDNSA
jgi:general stress protein YciG